MAEKIGRNEPCWCGSGNKYKKCHYGREKEQQITPQDVIQAMRKGYSVPECLHPNAPDECEGGIIKAHTIQRNGGLSRIARNGHVYTPFSPIPNFKGKFDLQYEGIKRASTFTGFCKYHDNQLFSPIEDNPILPTEEHALLLAFRAISRELFVKKRAVEMIDFGKSTDKGKNIVEQLTIQEEIGLYELGARAGLRDLEHHKSLMDTALLAKDYDDVYFYAIEFNCVPDILCSGGILPEYDFIGKEVQDLWKSLKTGAVAEAVTLSLLATETGGVAMFSWIGASKANFKLIKSLHKFTDKELPDALVRFIFEYFENAYIRPDWWDNLTQEIRDKLLKRYIDTINSHAERNPNCLVDDGVRSVSWGITARQNNLGLEVVNQ